MLFFSSRRRHTSLQGDWSADVCSSDLNTGTNPQSANRVRGIGAANVARGNFATTGTIPIDTYNVDSVEISRGPRSEERRVGKDCRSRNATSEKQNKNMRRLRPARTERL